MPQGIEVAPSTDRLLGCQGFGKSRGRSVVRNALAAFIATISIASAAHAQTFG
jgi:hypothetical protein